MMRMEKAGEQRRRLHKTQAEWERRKNYRVWDANRKIFLYPENWIEPELRLSTRFRAALGRAIGVASFKHLTLRPARIRLGQRVLLFSASSAKNRTGNAIKTRSPEEPEDGARSSTYTRFGSTLTISGERNAPRWL